MRIGRLVLAVLMIASLLQFGSSQDSRDKYFNYGRLWKSWSDSVRSVYLEGFIDGHSDTFFKMSFSIPADKREQLKKATFTFYEDDVLRDVISDLYKDPANSFITFSAMVYIARDRLDGNDIEERLKHSRQFDLGFPTK